MWDFIVVGAGPSGSRFARRAATNGYDVLVLERGEVGPPLACSGHLSRDIWKFAPEGSKEALLQNEIYGARFHVGGPNSRGYRFYTTDPISNALDRVELDRRLAAAAEDAGAEIRTGHTVTDLDIGQDRVSVTASTTDGPVTIETRMVAGCDGPASRVRRAANLPEPRETLHGVLGFSEEDDFDDYVDVHLTEPGFFAWRIPRGTAGVEYGLAVRPGSADAGQRLEALAEGYGVDLVKRCSGLIPIGPPDRVSNDRVFLIGDAAAQTKPFTGGGILYGMRSADHAAETIDPTTPASTAAYERAWRDDLAGEIRLGSLIRRAYSLPSPIQHVGLRLTSGEIGVHMDRPTTIFSRRHLRKAFRLG